MSDKEFVTMEYKMCPVTGEEHNVGLIMDRKLRKKFGRKTVTGYAFCPEVQEEIDKGFVALVEVDPAKSTIRDGRDTLTMEDAYRTGNLCYIKKEIALKIFGDSISDMNFIEADVFNQITKKSRKVNKGKKKKKK